RIQLRVTGACDLILRHSPRDLRAFHTNLIAVLSPVPWLHVCILQADQVNISYTKKAECEGKACSIGFRRISERNSCIDRESDRGQCNGTSNQDLANRSVERVS